MKTRVWRSESMGRRVEHKGNKVNVPAYETAVRLYPRDLIRYRDGARIIARSRAEGNTLKRSSVGTPGKSNKQSLRLGSV